MSGLTAADLDKPAAGVTGESVPGVSGWVQNVWQVVYGIPRGFVLTYGEVSRLAGPGGSPRVVSKALGKAPKGMKLPWHRVINSHGRISFPRGSADYRRQKSRLEKEGVVFLNGKTDLARYGYAGALDLLLWGSKL